MSKIGATIAGIVLVAGTGVAVEAGRSFDNSLEPSNQETEYRQDIVDFSAKIGALSTSSAIRESLLEDRDTANYNLATDRKMREQNLGSMAGAVVLGGVFAVGGLASGIIQVRKSIRLPRSPKPRQTASV